MKTHLKEQIRKKLLKFGKKNKVCRLLAIPALITVMFFFQVVDYLKGNSKKLTMAALALCLFVVYSSFSFPLFVMGNRETSYRLETESDVELAPEADIDLEEVERLADEEFADPGSEEYDFFGEDEDVDSYGTSEVLAALEGYGRQEEEESPEEKPDEGISFSKDDWRLILVNKQHSIPEDYTFQIATFMSSKCDERILDDLADMFRAAKADGINLVIRSPYRSHEHQIANFGRKITLYMGKGMSYMEAYQLGSRVVAVPGNSEHEIGLALDITCEGFPSLLQSFIDTDAGKWLAENGCKYGFIVRYPEGKEYITGIMYEPWHMRYVGKEAATYITEKGICLEEFWEEL